MREYVYAKAIDWQFLIHSPAMLDVQQCIGQTALAVVYASGCPGSLLLALLLVTLGLVMIR